MRGSRAHQRMLEALLTAGLLTAGLLAPTSDDGLHPGAEIVRLARRGERRRHRPPGAAGVLPQGEPAHRGHVTGRSTRGTSSSSTATGHSRTSCSSARSRAAAEQAGQPLLATARRKAGHQRKRDGRATPTRRRGLNEYLHALCPTPRSSPSSRHRRLLRSPHPPSGAARARRAPPCAPRPCRARG